jgi:N-acetyl-alpha-D-muramate 1-phosphate uridylyltransferase
MQIAIIAGGFATRLGPLTKNTPKSLIPIKGKPFIEYQLDFLRRGGITDVVLCLGHLGESIEKYCGDGRRYGLVLKYSYEKKPLDTAGALKNAEPLLQDHFFTLYGDSFIFVNYQTMLDNLVQSKKLASMSIYKNQGLYDNSNTSAANGMVVRYSKTDNRGMEYIDYGVNLFKKEVLGLVPPSTPYSLESLFAVLIKSGELLAFEVTERFYEIGSINGLREFTGYIEEQR